MERWIHDEIRKDPDEEFDWREHRVSQINTLLEKLLEDENIDHDVFLNCVDDVTTSICKAMKRRTK